MVLIAGRLVVDNKHLRVEVTSTRFLEVQIDDWVCRSVDVRRLRQRAQSVVGVVDPNLAPAVIGATLTSLIYATHSVAPIGMMDSNLNRRSPCPRVTTFAAPKPLNL